MIDCASLFDELSHGGITRTQTVQDISKDSMI